MRPKIVLLGDSITERGFNFSMRGWGLQLSSWYGVKADVINRGHSGYNTRIAMDLLEKRREGWYHYIENEIPATLVVIFWGANDAAQYGVQGIPVEEYKSRLSSQIQKVRETGQTYASKNDIAIQNEFTKVVLITPPPVRDEDWLKEIRTKRKEANKELTEEELVKIEIDRNNKTAGIFAAAAIEVANQEKCPIINLYDDMQSNPPPGGDFSSYLCDGLHLSSEGNDYLFRALKKVLSKDPINIGPDSITKDFLEWRDALAESNKK